MRRAGPVLVALAAAVAAAGAGARGAAAQAADPGPIYLDPGDVHGAPEVSAAASPSEVVLGTPFVLIVTVAHDDPITVNLPSRLDLGPAFEERGRRSADRVRSDGRRVREWQIEVIAWELGDLEVPGVQVTFVRAGQASAVVANPVPVRVTGTLGDVADGTPPRALAPPLPLWRRTWTWVIVLAVVLVALRVAYALVRRRRRVAAPAAAPPRRVSGLIRRVRLGGPAEEALTRLEAVDASGLLARDRRLAYTEMIAIVQTFLARQLGDDDVEELTTGELRRWLAGADLAAGTRLALARWFDEADLVKFGGLRPPVEDGRAHLAAARDLVIAIAAPGDAGRREAAAGG